MSNHCWRNARPIVNEEDDKAWPKLSHSTAEERLRMRSIQRPRLPKLLQDLGSGSEVSNLHQTLNEIDYPKLGDIVLKIPDSFVDNSLVEFCAEPANADLTRPRVLRSTDIININIHKMLEARRPLPLQMEHATRITIDLCKLNVNMADTRGVSAPLDCRWLQLNQTLQRNVGHIAKKKKTSSRNELLIIHHGRMFKRELEAYKRQIRRIQDADGGINFERSSTVTQSRDEPDLVRKMAALSCLSTNYRNTRQVTISEDTVIFRPDVHEKMGNLSLGDGDDCRFVEVGGNENSNDQDMEGIDCDAMEAVLTLKVCDETGKHNDNSIKQEPGRIRFSKKFREYCTNTVTPNLRKHLEEFLKEITRLQKRMYERVSVKEKCKRRYYAGIKEVHKQIDLKKIKFVVIAPDIETVETEGELHDTLNILVGTCKRHQVPYCFGLSRRKLGYHIHGNGFVSCVGISNYGGAEEKLKNVLVDVVEARNEFARLLSDEARTIDLAKLLPKEELILSEVINAYSRILASSS